MQAKWAKERQIHDIEKKRNRRVILNKKIVTVCDQWLLFHLNPLLFASKKFLGEAKTST